MNRFRNIICTVLLAAASMTAAAQSKNYKETMKKGIAMMDSAKKSSAFIKAGDDFAQIALHEKTDWLSGYYAGVCYALAAFMEKGKAVDPLCDKAGQYAAMADSLNRENPEILILKSMIASARITANPPLRGKKFGDQANLFINDALKYDPGNPRAYLMKAQGVYYTPELFGGGAAKAKPLYETALEKYKTYKPKYTLYPHWGKDVAEEKLAEIQAKLKKQ